MSHPDLQSGSHLGDISDIISSLAQQVHKSSQIIEALRARVSALESDRGIFYDTNYDTTSPASKGRFLCRAINCSRSFKTQQFLSGHIRSAPGPGHRAAQAIIDQIKCQICDHESKAPQALASHERFRHQIPLQNKKQTRLEAHQLHFAASNIDDAPFSSLDKDYHPCACWIKPFANLAQSQDTQALQSLCRMYLEMFTSRQQSDRERKRAATSFEGLDWQHETSMSTPKTRCACHTKRQRRHIPKSGQSNQLFLDADEEDAEQIILQSSNDSASNGVAARIPISNTKLACSFQSTSIPQAFNSNGTSDSESSDKTYSSQPRGADTSSPSFRSEVGDNDHFALSVANERLRAQAAEADDTSDSSQFREHTSFKHVYPIPDPTASIDIGEL
ncbi:MAG: hypothetical protein Q9182_001068 [Xanthomendoza sp. 2 TL-2023]